MQLLAAQQVVQGNGMPHAALGAVRSHHHHIAYAVHHLNQGSDSGCGYAVVVAYQNQGALLPICHVANLIRKSARVLYFHTRKQIQP